MLTGLIFWFLLVSQLWKFPLFWGVLLYSSLFHFEVNGTMTAGEEQSGQRALIDPLVAVRVCDKLHHLFECAALPNGRAPACGAPAAACTFERPGSMCVHPRTS